MTPITRFTLRDISKCLMTPTLLLLGLMFFYRLFTSENIFKFLLGKWRVLFWPIVMPLMIALLAILRCLIDSVEKESIVEPGKNIEELEKDYKPNTDTNGDYVGRSDHKNYY